MQETSDIIKEQKYCYDIMMTDIEELKQRYPFIKWEVIGYSVLGKPIPALRLGEGLKEISFNASHHGIEWITTLLLMKFIEEYAKHYTSHSKLYDYNMIKLYKSTSIWIVPMVNPDGVDVAIKGLSQDNPHYQQLLQWNRGNPDFPHTWKANIRGVDLNHNYDAGWQASKVNEKSVGVFGPAPTRFSGTQAESEPESKALADFTRNHSFRLVIALHSQGKEIYWNYIDKAPAESANIANTFQELSGYRAVGNCGGPASHAGYKDWFIDKFQKPGFTIEVGKGVNPLPLEQFPAIWNDTIRILLSSTALV